MPAAEGIEGEDLLDRERFRVPAGRSVRRAQRDAASVQVWLVDDRPAPPDEVDPALVRRLRALGYGQ